jgi:hypothetical protein
MTFVAGPLGGFLAAHSEKAGVVVITLFVIGGILEGYGLAVISCKITDSISRSKKIPTWAELIFSMLIPSTALLASMFLPVGLAAMIYR